MTGNMGELRQSLMEAASASAAAHENFRGAADEAALTNETTMGSIRSVIASLIEQVRDVIDTSMETIDSGAAHAKESTAHAAARLGVLAGGGSSDETLLGQAQQLASDTSNWNPSAGLENVINDVVNALNAASASLEGASAILANVQQEATERANKASAIASGAESRANSLGG